MKRQARETQLATGEVIENATNNLPAIAAANMPSLQSLKKTVRNVRQHENPQRRQPATLAELELPDDVTLFENGDSFLLYDSGPAAGNNRYFRFPELFSIWPHAIFLLDYSFLGLRPHWKSLLGLIQFSPMALFATWTDCFLSYTRFMEGYVHMLLNGINSYIYLNVSYSSSTVRYCPWYTAISQTNTVRLTRMPSQRLETMR